MEGWQSAIRNGTHYIIISTTPNRIVQTFNKSAETLLGFTKEEVLENPCPTIFEPGQAKSFLGRTTLKRKDGTLLNVHLLVTTIFGENSEIIGYLAVAEDVTEIIEYERTIENQKILMLSTAKFSA